MNSPLANASTPLPLWLPTGRAAQLLGCSPDTLKRYAIRDEFLISGEHWRRGPHANSPWVWNVPACEEAIRWRGRCRVLRDST